MSEAETSKESAEVSQLVEESLEESLLSPQTEVLTDIGTELSDGIDEQGVVGSMADLQVGGDDPGLSTSKSMESIQLEISRVDESEVVVDIPGLYVMANQPSDSGQDSDESPGHLQDLPDCPSASEKVLGEIIATVAAATESDISEYFKSDVVGHESDTSFFDNLAQGSTADGASIDTASPTGRRKMLSPLHVTIDSESEDKTDTPQGSVSPNIHITLDDAKPVSFEEAKGAGFKPTPSTKNLSQFFGDGSDSNNGKAASFFDVFTADEGEVPLQSPRSSRTFSQSDTSIGSVPPETPPIPSSVLDPPMASPLQMAFPAKEDSQMSVAADVSFSINPDTKDAIAAFSGKTDPFRPSLCASDVDRRSDVWIPSEATQQVLVAKANCSYIPDDTPMSWPKIMIDTSLGDPVLQHVESVFGEEEARKRVVITADHVPQDDSGLRQLISCENWRAAVDLTTRLLTGCGQGPDRLNNPAPHTPHSLQLWFVRIALLMKLRLYADAESECQAFGNLDSGDLYYEFYPDVYGGRRGSMVSFDFRVLHAELPQYQGKSQESLDRLYYLHAIVLKILSNLSSGLAEDGSMLQLSDESRAASRELWESREVRLMYAAGNCALNLKDYAVALKIYDKLLKSDATNEEGLLCGIGRIFLQMGDISRAEDYFQRGSALSDKTDQLSRQRNILNKGFVALGQNQFSEAHAHFKEVVDLNPTNAVAINNMAVCSLYMGRLTDALATLETRVMEQPMTFLQESILFNLCTLYELESSHAMQKKQTLLGLVNRHKGNGFNIACLKMV